MAANSFQKTPAPRNPVQGFGSGGSRGFTRTTNEGPQCYKCKGYGHYAVVCLTRDKKVAYICEKELLTMEEDIETGEPSEDSDSEGEHLSASALPSCVINRVLNREKREIQSNPEWLCTNSFHTRWNIIIEH